MNVRGGKFPVGYSRIFRSILHPEGMKHTGNQKVVTAAKWLLLQFSGKYRPIRQNPFVKALSAPYRACTALPDKNTAYAVTIQNRGLWRVAIYRFQIGELPPGAIQ